MSASCLVALLAVTFIVLSISSVSATTYGSVDIDIFTDSACTNTANFLPNRTYSSVAVDGSVCYTSTGNGPNNWTTAYTVNCASSAAFVETVWFNTTSCSGYPSLTLTHTGSTLEGTCTAVTALVNFTGMGNVNNSGNGTTGGGGPMNRTLYSQFICSVSSVLSSTGSVSSSSSTGTNDAARITANPLFVLAALLLAVLIYVTA